MRAGPIAACSLIVATSLLAQRPPDGPRRPSLPRGADTNSSAAYYEFGSQRLRRNPREAAAAFYWAERLDPECAGCLHGRYVARLIEDPERVVGYWAMVPAVLRQPEVRAIDSLMRKALMIDPFLYRRFNGPMIYEIGAILASRQGSDLRYLSDAEIETAIARVDPSLGAIVNYHRGRFAETQAWWAEQAGRQPRNAALRAERGRLYFLQQRYDSARVMMAEAIRIARERDADSMRLGYESKAAWEFSVARIHETMGNADSARVAYERTLVEDLSYFPAHLRLGMLLAARGDTAGALREMSLAVAAKEDEYLPHVTYGYYLATAGRLDSAAAQLERAAALEPWAPQPRIMLGSVLDAAGDRGRALAAFEAFVARAPRNDRDLPAVTARIGQLRAAGP